MPKEMISFLRHFNATSSLTNAETAFLCGNEIHFRDGGRSENLRGPVELR